MNMKSIEDVVVSQWKFSSTSSGACDVPEAEDPAAPPRFRKPAERSSITEVRIIIGSFSNTEAKISFILSGLLLAHMYVKRTQKTTYPTLQCRQTPENMQEETQYVLK